MALRICLVTPFSWSKPHEVNEHVAGVAQELRVLGHAVTIIASSPAICKSRTTPLTRKTAAQVSVSSPRRSS